MNRSKLWICTIALGLVASGGVSAEPIGAKLGLAAPGPCAEPLDSALRGDPVYRTASGEGDEAPDFTIAGDPIRHFDPVDVAAGPNPDGLPRPKPNDFGPPCSTPDAGCVGVIAGVPTGGGGGVVIEGPAQPGGLPGTGDN